MMRHEAERFRKGDKVLTPYGEVETVTSVRPPMVYTLERPESSPSGGWHWAKLFLVGREQSPK
jgi:hypothetical protein